MKLLSNSSFVAIASLLLISRVAFGAHSFSEDFSGGPGLPASLEEAYGFGDSFVFGGGVQIGVTGGAFFREYVRTVENDYFSTDFVAQVTVTVPGPTNDLDHSAFFGIGQGYDGVTVGSFGEPDKNPTIYMRVAPSAADVPSGSNEADTTQVIQDFLSPTALRNETFIVAADPYDPPRSGTQELSGGGLASGDPAGVVGSGTHRLQLAWDATDETATFSIDVGNDGGGAFDLVTIPFAASPQSADIIDGPLDDSNMHIYIGGALGVRFDDLSVTVSGAAVLDNANFDLDADVDGGDFLTWQRGFGTESGLIYGNANHSGNAAGINTPTVDVADLGIWEDQFGASPLAAAATTAVPEPGTVALAGLAAGLACFVRRKQCLAQSISCSGRG
ncbi:MAG: PEP-CTERM sorting domain-containing protein [Pirellulales bacterium]